ncbi:MAG: hypothetical protein UU88_C0008G0004 [Parcubacteria group bacterium GW2011_GWC1_42_11]|uniref:UPF0102 protein UV12_C0002G0076 n=1 Tax=Candidatus Nomurabacteria bacterium GW2011_GWC2_42_20 TaxID=1618756 RepID=A0A0G0ZHP1_9BACT|nr:MAG: hypothetical protein UU88_C0008G0004 [Parcubacteria group bacterium GW2011_GWC1_42_11]KKS48227.1 MAG: hypothetical protein UV12_C0002G0076 [Candidatus Nomurabacteria bacterium GW2011_GWC2_42_20]KKS59357.1 MAG: hypothetical protein UV24_C0002G0023 [Candidatus Nomurabacteria bacterium GW2011_GWA2_42_41]KKT09800.1 MAG: hypothetical protein UV86_C0002G0043 [Candidatus Nomurabacteria bacterium GW2011_GWB1_43_20]HBH71806.1 hypothetical protein [Candidatus Yonathbacteria bacterium]
MVLMAEPTEKQKIGKIGEDVAKKYLENKGFSVICQNYRKKCGEIDIIAQKGKILHFIEVKTVTRENIGKNVSMLQRHEFANSETDSYRPEDNIHPYKLKRLARTIQMYLIEKYRGDEPDWVFDAITVKLDIYNRRARVRFLDNIVL